MSDVPARHEWDAVIYDQPLGHVVAVDGTTAMLEQLRSRLSGTGADRRTVLRLDLAEPWELPEPVDAAVSVDTLHWLSDHDLFFRSLFAALRPGGVLRAEAVSGLVRMPPGAQWESLMRTVILGPVLDRLPAEGRDPVVAEVSNRLSDHCVSYVRLQATARRPAS